MEKNNETLNSRNQSYFYLWWPRFKVKGHRLLSSSKIEIYLPLKSMQPGQNFNIAKRCAQTLNYKTTKFQISVTTPIRKAELWKMFFESKILHFRNSILLSTQYTADLRGRKKNWDFFMNAQPIDLAYHCWIFYLFECSSFTLMF